MQRGKFRRDGTFACYVIDMTFEQGEIERVGIEIMPRG